MVVFTIILLLWGVTQVSHGHTFVLDEDGSLQAIGYDVNSNYNTLTVGSNLTIHGGVIDASSASSGITIDLRTGEANGLIFQSSAGREIVRIDTTFGKEEVVLGGELKLPSGLLKFTGPNATIFVPDGSKNALVIRSKYNNNIPFP